MPDLQLRIGRPSIPIRRVVVGAVLAFAGFACGQDNQLTGPTKHGATRVEQAPTTAPLRLTLSIEGSHFGLGDLIEVTVTYQNVSAETIRVLDLVLQSGVPLSFDIRDAYGRGVLYTWPRGLIPIKVEDYVELAPGDTHSVFVHLNDRRFCTLKYDLGRPGTYVAQASYSPLWGLPGSASNRIDFTVEAESWTWRNQRALRSLRCRLAE